METRTLSLRAVCLTKKVIRLFAEQGMHGLRAFQSRGILFLLKKRAMQALNIHGSLGVVGLCELGYDKYRENLR